MLWLAEFRRDSRSDLRESGPLDLPTVPDRLLRPCPDNLFPAQHLAVTRDCFVLNLMVCQSSSLNTQHTYSRKNSKLIEGQVAQLSASVRGR